MKPNFIGIGAAKCGTTWLSEVLRSHPQVFVAHGKELNYFTSQKQYNKGLEWYLANFEGGAGCKAVGEFSVSYMDGKSETARQIYELNPKIKLLVAVRNPIDRAFSHYRWLIQLGKKLPSFIDALEIDSRLVHHSLYYHNMVPYWDSFPREQILIVLYDDIKSSPHIVQKKLYRFLEVHENFDSGLCSTVVGRTINPRFRNLEDLRIKAFNEARKHNLSFLITLFKKTGLSNLYRRINDSTCKMQSLTRDERLSAYHYFEEDLDKFHRETGEDISLWFLKA